MPIPPSFDRLTALTQSNRALLELAGSGTCLACHSLAPLALITHWRDDTALCPNCGREALVPALTTALLDKVALDYYGVAPDPTQTPDIRAYEDASTTAIVGEILPFIARIEARLGQRLLAPLWATLTRTLASLGASLEQLHAGVDAQYHSQQAHDSTLRRH